MLSTHPFDVTQFEISYALVLVMFREFNCLVMHSITVAKRFVLSISHEKQFWREKIQSFVIMDLFYNAHWDCLPVYFSASHLSRSVFDVVSYLARVFAEQQSVACCRRSPTFRFF